MSATATRFYVTGGTLRPDAPSYVERQADADLYEGLIVGDSWPPVARTRRSGSGTSPRPGRWPS
jgi:hypothetical protein